MRNLIFVFILLLLVGCISTATENSSDSQKLVISSAETQATYLNAGIINLPENGIQALAESEISTTIYNSGVNFATYNAVLRVNGVITDEKKLIINPGEGKDVSFKLNLPKLGIYEISIGNSSVSVDVKEYGLCWIKASDNYSQRSPLGYDRFIANKSPLFYPPWNGFEIYRICLSLDKYPISTNNAVEKQPDLFIKIYTDQPDTDILWQGSVSPINKLTCSALPPYYREDKMYFNKKVVPIVGTGSPFFFIVSCKTIIEPGQYLFGSHIPLLMPLEASYPISINWRESQIAGNYCGRPNGTCYPDLLIPRY